MHEYLLVYRGFSVSDWPLDDKIYATTWKSTRIGSVDLRYRFQLGTELTHHSGSQDDPDAKGPVIGLPDYDAATSRFSTTIGGSGILLAEGRGPFSVPTKHHYLRPGMIDLCVSIHARSELSNNVLISHFQDYLHCFICHCSFRSGDFILPVIPVTLLEIEKIGEKRVTKQRGSMSAKVVSRFHFQDKDVN